jgi:hypothetical protein
MMAMASTEAALAIAAAVVLNFFSLTIMFQMWQRRDDMMVRKSNCECSCLVCAA